MRITRISLTHFLRSQAIYITVAVLVAAIFWAIGQNINPLTILVYSITLGNLTTFPMEAVHPLYLYRRFPYNWLIFLALLAALLVPVYLASSTLVWWIAPPSPQTLEHYLRTGWKFPILITVTVGIGQFLYETAKKRLEARNRELEESIERESAKVEMQNRELQRAREIQESLLPKEIPQVPGFEIAAAWRPAREVSGDYFDVFRLSEKKLALCIADVVGKGVSAALLMANMQSAVRAFASDGGNPAGVCTRLNQLLCENIATGKFVTCIFAVLDCSTRMLVWCNAGHLNPLLVRRNAAESLNGGGAVLGVFPHWNYCDEQIQLAAGDRLLMFTDGITEAAEGEHAEFGEERVAQCALESRKDSADAIHRRLLDCVERHCSAQFQDDATLLVIAAD